MRHSQHAATIQQQLSSPPPPNLAAFPCPWLKMVLKWWLLWAQHRVTLVHTMVKSRQPKWNNAHSLLIQCRITGSQWIKDQDVNSARGWYYLVPDSVAASVIFREEVEVWIWHWFIECQFFQAFPSNVIDIIDAFYSDFIDGIYYFV